MMPKEIYINLPVKDLQKSIAFFTAVGFSFDPKFTSDSATCMIINEGSIYCMLLTEAMFAGFTKKPISDATKTTEVINAIKVSTKEEADDYVKKAIAAGGSIYSDPVDHGWMYQHAFADLDGHQWEVFFMDETKMPQN
jgi:uncharacterized protein